MRKMFLVLSFIFCFAVSAIASPFLVGNTQDLINSGWSSSNLGMDWEENVYEVIRLYNGSNFPLLPSEPFLLNEVEYSIPPEIYEGSTWNFTPGTEFISFKYDSVFELWHLDGDLITQDNPLNFGPWNHALSHHREWGTNPVPEPTTMILLGTGLLGLGCTVRRKIKKI